MKKRWSEYCRAGKIIVVVLALVQLGLLAAALIDIARAQESEVRGRKLWWVLGSFVNYLGPIAWFLAGRKVIDGPVRC